MGDNGKKHSRKSKLVERTYEDVEDPCEDKCKPKKVYKKKKIAPKPPEETKPPIELAVQIEPEDGDDGWYKAMLEQERLEKLETIISNAEDKTVRVGIRSKSRTLNEKQLKKIISGQGIICIDSSYTINRQDPLYSSSVILETLLMSPYSSYNGPIYYNNLHIDKNRFTLIRSHLIYKHICLPCKNHCASRQQFMTHIANHNVSSQVYYTITKVHDIPTFLCTTQPTVFINDGVIADIGIGNFISIVHDYETAIRYVLTKWHRSDKEGNVFKGILSYKCYSCTFVCEYYTQFLSHLNEIHDPVRVLITTEILPDKHMNLVASSDFKPFFRDFLQSVNQSKYKCFKCKKIFDSCDGYRSHLKRINVCAGCGIELNCNMMKQHEGGCTQFLNVFYPKMCPCKKEFLSASEMAKHQNGNCQYGRTALVFNCIVCKYLSPSSVRLLTHQRLEHYVRSDLIYVTFKVNICQYCGEKYVGSFSMHYCCKREDIVDCSSCGMMFQNEYFLHIHTKAYPSANCCDCNEHFELSCGLMEHNIKKHGYENVAIKYKCTICNVLFDNPNPDGDGLNKMHIMDLHKTDKTFIYNYKKIYMPKSVAGHYGYHTGIFPPEGATDKMNTEDLEDLIDVVVIKKSNILSKTNCNIAPSKKRLPKVSTVYDTYQNLSNTIYQEHNYDVTQSSAAVDGSYEIDKVNTDIVYDGSNTQIMIQEEAQLLSQRRTKSTVKSHYRHNMDVAINNIRYDNTQQHLKIEFDDALTKSVGKAETEVKYEMNTEADFNDNEYAENIILDSFSEINEDMIKCEPEAETILVKTQVPVTFTPIEKAGCSKDIDYEIKTEAMSDDESDFGNFIYNNDADKKKLPKDQKEITFAPQNNVITNLLFETEENIDEAVDNTKAAKRKLTDPTMRVTKSKPNPDIPETLTESNEFATENDLTVKGSKDMLESVVKSSVMTKETSETLDNSSRPVKKNTKPKKRRKRFIPLKKKPKSSKKTSEPFRGFEKQGHILESLKKTKDINKKILENQVSVTARENTDTVPEFGESSTADTALMKSKTIDNKKDKIATVKLEIKEEVIDEYETDLIIFDEANSSNDGATDEKFVEVNPKSILKESTSKPKIYFCKRCKFTGHHKGYKDHLNVCRKVSPKRSNQPSNKKVQILTYNCIKCNLECDDLRDYLKHLPGHGYEDMHCPCCNEEFPSLNKLAKHVLTHIKADFKRICFLHLDNKPMELKKFRCCNCKLIVDQEDFFGHWQVHFGRLAPKKQPRDIRIAVLKAEYGDLARSMALETGVKNETCEILQMRDPARTCLLCRKHFTRMHDIKRHLIEHLTMDALCNRPNVKSMKCQICDEDFDYTDLYKRHMRDHASLPLYQCQICDKSFSDSSNFGKHKKVHDVFEFVCDICRRKFQTKSMLVGHMLLHEKHQIITCEFCLKKFYFPSSYKKHIRAAHEKGIPKHSCTLCRTRFLCVKDQLNHEWREHGLRKTPVDCPLCDQGYRRLIDLKMHLKNTHSMPFFTMKNRTRVEEMLKDRGLTQSKIDLVISRLNTAKTNND